MKSIKALVVSIAIFGAALPVAVPMQGCAAFSSIEQGPRGVYFETQEVFIATVIVATQHKRQGQISQADWDSTIYPAIVAGDALLDAMESSLSTEDFDGLKATRALLISLIEVIGGRE